MPNCWIYTNSPNMCIHIWLHSSSLVNCPSLVNFLKSWEELSRICGSCKIISISRTVLRPSAVKYSRGGTLVGGNWLPVSYVPGSMSFCFGLGSVIFGGWLGDFRNVIFSNAINIVWCNNILGTLHELLGMSHLSIIWCNNTPGELHELLAMIHLDYMFWV